MAHDGRYPSPDVAGSAHPYHSNTQPVPNDGNQQLNHAATAIMQDADTTDNNVPQGFHYVAQYGNPSPSTPQQLAQQTLDVDQGPPATDSAAKKTKVSRACDECRRKKVRCDAESDQQSIQCSNCKRLGAPCEFTRQPQKRGPSKGYIRELAERVHRLEYPGQGSAEGQFDNQTFSPQAEFSQPNQRKRTHSAVDGGPNYSADQLTDFTRPQQPSFQNSVNPVISAPIYDLPAPTTSSMQSLSPAIMEAYTRRLHPAFPLLPHAPDFQSQLDRAPPELRQTHIHAVTNAVNAEEGTLTAAQMKSCADQCLSLQSQRQQFTSTTHQAIYLQTLVFMALADELQSPSTSQSGFWLGCAVSSANSMHAAKSPAKHDLDDPAKTFRRAWLCLVILDRWHAAANCTATMIPNESVNLTAVDHGLLGSLAFHLLRISLALGHLSNIFLYHSNDLDESRPTGRTLTQLMQGEVDRIFESVEPLFSEMPTLHLAYLYLKLLADKATDLTSPGLLDGSAADTAVAIVQQISSQTGSETSFPLLHHTLGLAIATFGTALPTSGNSSGGPVVEALRQALEYCQRTGDQSGYRLSTAWHEAFVSVCLQKLSASDGKSSSNLSAATAAAASTASKLRRGGLDHLAEAAVGANKNSNNGNEDNKDGMLDGGSSGKAVGPKGLTSTISNWTWTEILTDGYMSIFIEAER